MAVRRSLAAEERLEAVVKILTLEGRVEVSALARDFEVTEMTIRRDLDELEALGVARRVRGGAVQLGPQPFSHRRRQQGKAKARIAEKLRGFIPASGIIAMDASSTVHRLAATLEGATDLTVVTNGLDTFHALDGKPGIAVLFTGGRLEPRSGTFGGPLACVAARNFLFQLFLCSSAAIDPRFGCSDVTLQDAEIQQAFGASAARIVLAVDSSKLGSRAQVRVFTLGQLEALVTDLEPGDPRLAPYAPEVTLV